MVSVRAFLSIWQHEWDLQDEKWHWQQTSALKSFLISKTYSSLVTLELSLPDAEDCSVHGPKCRHVLLWSTHHVNLVDVSCMRSASTPLPCTWTTSHSLASVNFPHRLRWSLVNLMGPVGWSRHELMLRAAVPTCLPHSSSEVPRAWHV